MSKVTLAAVARAAGVSPGTASKAINDRADIADETRQRVLSEARRLGYRPTPRTQPTTFPRIWLCLDEMTNTYAAGLLDGLIGQASALEADVSVHRWRGMRLYTAGRVTDQWAGSPSAGDPLPAATRPGTPDWIRVAAHRGAQAIILATIPVTAAHQAICTELGLPLIAVDPAVRPPAGTMTIAATNWRGGVQATEHLVGLGHRRIAYVGGAPESIAGAERAAGYRTALTRAGVDIDDELILPGNFRGEDGRACIDLLRSADRPTAVFAASDAVAFGVLDAARDAGLRVPDDLSIIGFDDGFAANWSSPALTSVRQPLAEMGALALRTAVNRIRDPRAGLPPVELATELVVRSTTARAPF